MNNDMTREWTATERAAMADKNPSATDWMLRISERQGDLTVTHELLERALGDAAWVGQLEQGSHTDYRHWQLFVQFPSRKRWSTIRRMIEVKNGIHMGYCRPRQGSVDQCVEYCSKSSTRVEGPYRHGEIKLYDQAGKRSDLQAIHDLIRSGERTMHDVMLDPELSTRVARYTTYLEKLQVEVDMERARGQLRQVKTLYMWGPAGSGKSQWVWDSYGGDAYRVTDYKHPWDSYRGQSVIVLEEYSPNASNGERHCLLLEDLLSVLDRYPFELSSRYHNGWAAWDTVIILSNMPLSDQYPGLDPRQRSALNRRMGVVFEKRTWDDVPPLPAVPLPPAGVQGSAAADSDDDAF